MNLKHGEALERDYSSQEPLGTASPQGGDGEHGSPNSSGHMADLVDLSSTEHPVSSFLLLFPTSDTFQINAECQRVNSNQWETIKQKARFFFF